MRLRPSLNFLFCKRNIEIKVDETEKQASEYVPGLTSPELVV
jgi:hypothetical protein